MRIRDRVARLLNIGGWAQFVWAVLGMVGINGVVVLGVAKWITPSTTWDYLFLASLFLALIPVSFPVSAWVLSYAVAKVDASRRKALFDDPIETARKRIDAMIALGQRIYDSLPGPKASYSEYQYHSDRAEHWLFQTDAELARYANQYAASWFVVDPYDDSWRVNPAHGTSIEFLRQHFSGCLDRLRQIREELPVDRRKWLRVSIALDIRSGRALERYLTAAIESSRENGESAVTNDFGAAELSRWAQSLESTTGSPPEFAYLFAPETFSKIGSPTERVEYVKDRIAELDRIWKAL